MIIRGHGVLWDPKRNKVAGRFVDGEIDTSDPRVIELAQAAGFVEMAIEATDERPTDKQELIEVAEERGIQIDKRWGIERIARAIEAAG